VSITEFDHWVGDNNIPAEFEYSKGWWDYVELVRRLASKFDMGDVRVIGHYEISTPPPSEQLPMPAVALAREGVVIAVKWDFGAKGWPDEWTVSVARRSPYLGPTCNLFDVDRDLRDEGVPGLEPDHLFGPYRKDASRFTCKLADEWDLVALLTLVLNEV
jgi:hypothetical protein